VTIFGANGYVKGLCGLHQADLVQLCQALVKWHRLPWSEAKADAEQTGDDLEKACFDLWSVEIGSFACPAQRPHPMNPASRLRRRSSHRSLQSLAGQIALF